VTQNSKAITDKFKYINEQNVLQCKTNEKLPKHDQKTNDKKRKHYLQLISLVPNFSHI
jgi:hypothetical protein